MYFKFICEKKLKHSENSELLHNSAKRKICSLCLAGISKLQNSKLQKYEYPVSNRNNSGLFRNLVREKDLPENYVVHRLGISIGSLLHSKLDAVRAAHAAHRHVELTVGEEWASVPHSHILEGLSWKTLD